MTREHDHPGSQGWDHPHKVGEYLERASTLPARLAGEAMLIEMLPLQLARLADLGCGDGRIAAAVLDARPDVREVVALDNSPPMLERARDRFAHDERAQVLEHDLTEPITGLGPFDAVVSGFAIHHLGDARKRELFAEITRELRPGGVFANLEVVKSATPELHAAFRAAIGREHDDPEDHLADVETQLTWMRDAGLGQVDCLWRWRGFALLVGEAKVGTERAPFA